MAAGDITRLDGISLTTTTEAFYDIPPAGTGPTLINPGLARILSCSAQWSEDIGPVASSLECKISTDEKSVTITNSAGLVRDACVMIVGL